MNKKLLAVAVLAAMTTSAIAAPTVYGNFRASVGQVSATADTLGLVNNASRVGIKGSTKQDGLTGYYHIQMGAQNDGAGAALSSRFYFAGVKGDFGNVKIGRLSHPYKMAGVSGGFDPFYDTSAGANDGGSSFGLSNDTNGFVDNSVIYYGKAGAISYNAGIMLHEVATGQKHGTNFGAKFSGKGFTAGVQMLNKVATDDTGLRVHGTFDAGVAKLTASFESIERGAADGTLIYVGAKAGAIIAQVGINSGDLGGAREAEGTGFSIGYVMNITKKTKVTPMFSSVDYKAGTDRTFVGVQLVQSF